MTIGTWALGGQNNVSGTALGWKNIPDRKAVELLKYTYENGLRSFDTSDFYGTGRSETLIKKAFGEKCNDVFITTKGGIKLGFKANSEALNKDFRPDFIKSRVENSAARLGRDYIDCYLLHGASNNDISDGLVDLVNEFKNDNRIGYFGISTRRSEANLNNVFANSALDVIQCQYSAAKPDHLLKLISEHKTEKIIMARSVFHHGLLLKSSDQRNFDSIDHRSRKEGSCPAEKVSLYQRKLREFFDLSVYESSLLLSVGNDNVDSVVVGVTNFAQVDQLLVTWEKCERIRNDISLTDLSNLAQSIFSNVKL